MKIIGIGTLVVSLLAAGTATAWAAEASGNYTVHPTPQELLDKIFPPATPPSRDPKTDIKVLHFEAGATEPVGYNVRDYPVYEHLDEAVRIGPSKLPAAAAQDLARIMHSLAVPDPARTGSYEVRVLGFVWQGSSNSMLWLKADDGSGDLFYTMPTLNPYGTARLHLQQDTLYTVAEFAAGLRDSDKQFQADKQKLADKRTAVFVANQSKTASGADTATTRLEALQAALTTVRTMLKQAPASAKATFAQSVADLAVAQADVVAGLNYVKAHPDVDRLVPSGQITDANGRYDDYGYKWEPSGPHYLGLLTGSVLNNSVFPALPAVDAAMRKSLSDFMGNPERGLAPMGEIGGNRDVIMRDVAVGGDELMGAIQRFLSIARPGAFPAVAVDSSASSPANPSARPGSIAGIVVRTDAKPAAKAVITFLSVDSPIYGRQPPGAYGLVYGALAGTISSDDGSFTIQDVPPGNYCVTAGRNRVFVEVKEGAETRLPVPLALSSQSSGGG